MNMFWSKKEEKTGLPDLPQMKQIQTQNFPDNEEDNEDEIERHSLPSFPDSPMKKGFAQAAIKDAVDQSINEDEEMPSKESKSFKTVETEEPASSWTPQSMPSNSIVEEMRSGPVVEKRSSSIPAMPLPMSPSITEKSATKPLDNKFALKMSPKKSEVYIKIDKFYTARKALETIKVELMEMDDLLKKIRDTRLREDQELSSWEKEVESIKERVKDVTENIFEKGD